MRVLVVADAGPEAGLGHLLRVRALIRALAERRHGVDLWVRGDRRALEGRDWPADMRTFVSARDEPLDVVRASIERHLDADPHDWLVLDGYDFHGNRFCDGLRAHRAKLMMLDDLGERELRADVVVNQSAPDATLYDASAVEADRLLVGPQYALIDAAYSAKPAARPAGPLRRLFITFGGVDRHERTRRVLELLADVPRPLEIVVAAGRYYPYPDRLAAPRGRHRVDVLVDLPDLADQMRWCDAMVTAAGSTVWQACCMGVPMLALQTVDNQRYVTKTLTAASAALCLDVSVTPETDAGIPADAFADAWRALDGAATRGALSECAARLVDGRGAARVADVLEAWPQ